MTLDQLMQRDARITALEAIHRRDRTAEQQDELGRLLDRRDQHWRRLGWRIEDARARLAQLEAYARQHHLVFT